MVAPDARKALEDENTLLDKLEKTASDSPAGARWSSYFRGWRKCNNDLLNSTDFDGDVNDEVKLLKKMRDSLAGDNSSSAKFYRDAISEDIQATEGLL